MGHVISMEAHRAKVATPSETPTIAPITRTTELALILALLDALPTEVAHAVFAKTQKIAERCPDCAASQEAARIAAIVTVAKGGAA